MGTKTLRTMANINFKDKVIDCKIVYYGPGRSGKTTNLQYIFKKYRKIGKIPKNP